MPEPHRDRPSNGASSLVVLAVVIGTVSLVFLSLPFSQTFDRHGTRPPGEPMPCPSPAVWLANPVFGHSHVEGADWFPERCGWDVIARLLWTQSIVGLVWFVAGTVGVRNARRLDPWQKRALTIGAIGRATLVTITTVAFAVATARNAYSDFNQRATILLTGVTSVAALLSWRRVGRLGRAWRGARSVGD